MTLPTFIKTGLVALALSATSLAAVPAQAAGISFNFGNGPFNGVHMHFGDHNYFNYCLSDHRVEDLLEDQYGFHNVNIVRESHDDDFNNRVWATGVKHHDFYMIRVDRCSKDVNFHKIDHDDHDHFDPGHIHLQFSF